MDAFTSPSPRGSRDALSVLLYVAVIASIFFAYIQLLVEAHRKGAAPRIRGVRHLFGFHHQKWATSTISREPDPGPSKVKTRKGNRARTPKPMLV
ncbi:hypothetical protein QFZ40_001090 [Arthrobacter pascens]|nr:hypothetical protein [Arthrobacter pascens]